MNDSSTTANRRQFLAKTLAAGTLGCVGCSRLATLGGTLSGKHKFHEDSGMSFKQVYEFACTERFIPFMRNLASQIGYDEFMEMLRIAAAETAAEQSKKQAGMQPRNDLATFAAALKEQEGRLRNVLTIEIVEDTSTAFETKITECIWAEVFGEANAADIGYAAICHPDFAAARAFNPTLKLIRTKTLMQGHDCCNHRWVMGG